jgi:ABC-2 type transport system ATP-binding protein
MATLEIDSLTKSYGSVRALQGTSFDVREGEIFGFVGSNGAGKTTTMRIVLGVLTPDGGEVRWDGRPIGPDARRRIGYMPEERGLYPRMRVADQLTYLARLHGLPAGAARDAMTRWTDTLGVAGRRGDEVQKLSLGNQQRVQLAAALTHEPDALVLDEPFSGLDPVAVDVMSDVLRDRADAGVPVVFSSHQLDLVERLCDRVGIIRDGEMVAVGTIDELRRTETERWVVDGPPGASWIGAVPGARAVSLEGSRTVVELAAAAGSDGGQGREQAVLRAALAAGPVREFAVVRPSLTELYRDVVSSPAADEAATTTKEEVHA